MTYPSPSDEALTAMLAGLDADPWEREQFREALAEADAEQAAGLLPPDAPYEPGPYGGDPFPPGSPELANLAEIGGVLDDRHAADAQRLLADVTDGLERRPSAERILARAIERIADGTYTPPPAPQPAPARGAGGRFGHLCGPADDLGYCTGRYHDAGCVAVTASAAASGSFADVERWNDVVRGRTSAADVTAAAQALGLASPAPEFGDPGGFAEDDLFGVTGVPGSADPELAAQVRGMLGLPAQPLRRPPEPKPDTQWLRRVLGLD
jgi:hypothetical protein